MSPVELGILGKKHCKNQATSPDCLYTVSQFVGNQQSKYGLSRFLDFSSKIKNHSYKMYFNRKKLFLILEF